METQTQAQSARSFYNRLSTSYEALSERSERPARLRGLRLLNPESGEHFLEIGFGTGHAVVALGHAVGSTGSVHGIDVSEGMLGLAQARVTEEGLGAWTHLQLADALHLPFEAKSFDGVFISFTLELFGDEQIPLVLAQIQRVLKDSGRLVVVCLSKEPSDTVATRLYERLHRLFPSFLDCHPIQPAELLETAHFQVQANEAFSMWGITGRAVLARPL